MSTNSSTPVYSKGLVFVSGLNNERKKRFTHKTRHGCDTCKKRRVKCDEGKPSCAQCARSGRRCEGYRGTVLDELKSSSVQRDHQVKTSIVPLQHRFGDATETKLFESYFRITAVELAKFCNPYVWYTLVPQMSIAHDCVKQALFAVALACEESSHSPTRGLARSKALSHYNESIRALTRITRPVAPTSTDVVLMCSVLFWLFENLKNRPYVAVAHMKGAVNILNERASVPRYRDDITTTYVEPLLEESLNLAGIDFVSKPKSRSKAMTRTGQDDSPQGLQTKIELNPNPKDIHAARLDFAKLQDAYNMETRTEQQASETRLGLLLQLHQQFNSTLDRNCDEWDEEYLRLLRLHCDMQIMGIEKRLDFSCGKIATRPQDDRTRLMRLLNESRFFARREIIKGDNSIQMSVITVLTAIVKNCSDLDEDIAIEALDILDKYEIFEGIWSSRVAGKVAQLIRYGDESHRTSKQGDLDIAFRRAAALKVGE